MILQDEDRSDVINLVEMLEPLQEKVNVHGSTWDTNLMEETKWSPMKKTKEVTIDLIDPSIEVHPH